MIRWSELTRKLEFHVEVQELNDSGQYVPVEVQPRTNVGTGGIFQLRQGNKLDDKLKDLAITDPNS